MKQILDERGHACPIPVLNTKKAAEEMTQGGTLEILVDNMVAVQNLQRFASKCGFEFCDQGMENGIYRVELQVPAHEAEEHVSSEGATEMEAKADGADSYENCCIPLRKKMVVAVNSGTMGIGNDELGANLMKAFLFALTKQETLPDTILFYNGGAFLTCEGSQSLEDLTALSDAGVTILTCGTCLSFYGISDKLKVGGVTNMYDIVEIQNQADLVIRP